MYKFEVKLPQGHVLRIVVEKNDGTMATRIADFVSYTFKEEPKAKGIQISVIADHFKKKGIPVTAKIVACRLRETGYKIQRGPSGRYLVVNPEYSKGEK
jgi:hypothetical protein